MSQMSETNALAPRSLREKLRLVGCGTGKLQGKKAPSPGCARRHNLCPDHCRGKQSAKQIPTDTPRRSTPQPLFWNFEHYWTIMVGLCQNRETSGNEMMAAAGWRLNFTSSLAKLATNKRFHQGRRSPLGISAQGPSVSRTFFHDIGGEEPWSFDSGSCGAAKWLKPEPGGPRSATLAGHATKDGSQRRNFAGKKSCKG